MTSVGGTIEIAERESEALLAAMVNAQRRGTSVLEDTEVHKHVSNVLVEQKEVVKYIHAVSDEEQLNMLVHANDQIVDVLQRLQVVRTPNLPRRPQAAASSRIRSGQRPRPRTASLPRPRVVCRLLIRPSTMVRAFRLQRPPRPPPTRGHVCRSKSTTRSCRIPATRPPRRRVASLRWSTTPTPART